MSRQSLFFALALIALLATFASATDTYMAVYTHNKKFSIKVSLANFGYFKYGHRLSGRVHIGVKYVDWSDKVTKDRFPKFPLQSGEILESDPVRVDFNSTDPNFGFDLTGCTKEFQQFNEDYISAYGAPIYFLERGGCTFTHKSRIAGKTGKMLIIADNSDVEDVDKIIMGDDFSGEKVMIPVVMVSRKDGALLHDFLLQEIKSNNTVDKENQIWISIVFNKPHEGKTASVQYWMIPAEKHSYVFLRTHQAFLDSLIKLKKIDFQPHFVFFRCEEDCQKASKYGDDNMEDFCLFDGKYCNFDPDGKGPLTGKDAVIQSVKELCIHSLFPDYFLSYFFHFHECYVNRQGSLQPCDTESQNFVIQLYPEADSKQNFKYLVRECVTKNTYREDTLLAQEYGLQQEWGIKFFPALFVNGDIFRGDLKLQEATEEYICEAINKADELKQCEEYTKIEDDTDIDSEFNIASNDPHSSTIIIVCAVLFIVFVIGLFVYRRKIRLEINKELALQVDSAIQQYYTLNDTK